MSPTHRDLLWDVTRPSMFQRMAGPPGPERDGAWEHLIDRYRGPIRACIRKRVRRHPEADGLVDEFFGYLCSQDPSLARFDPDRGRFRAWIQGVVRVFLLQRRREMAVQAAGGDDVQLDLIVIDAPPEAEVDDERAWARAVFDVALARLRDQHAGDARLIADAYGLGGRAPLDGPALAARDGKQLAAVQKALSRARQRLGAAIDEAIVELVGSEADLEAEQAALRGRMLEACPGLLEGA